MTVTDDVELYFPKFPPDDFRREFDAYVTETNSPESFRGLSWTRDPLNLAESIIITRVVVEKKKRAGKLVPCSYCNGTPKFYEGVLVWSPDGKIRLIGCRCKNHINSVRSQEMDTDFRKREAYDAGVAFLEKNILKGKAIRDEVSKLQDIAHTLSQYKNHFRGNLTDLYALLERTQKAGGELKVAVQKKKDEIYRQLTQGKGGDTFVYVTSHRLIGGEFLQRQFQPYNICEKALAFFEQIANLTEESRGEFILSKCNDRDQLIDFVREFKSNTEKVVKMQQQMRIAALFFGKDNLDGLETYGGHDGGDLRFDVQQEKNNVAFYVHTTGDFHRFEIGQKLFVPEISMPAFD